MSIAPSTYAAYRRTLRLARSLPSASLRDATISQIRHLAKYDVNIEEKLESRAAALRAILPRQLWPASELGRLTPADISDVITVNRNERPRKRSGKYTSKVPGVHADDLARHRALQERFHFGGPVWRG